MNIINLINFKYFSCISMGLQTYLQLLVLMKYTSTPLILLRMILQEMSLSKKNLTEAISG